MKRKGQYLVVGEMLIFAIGLIITISLVALFNSIDSRISEPTKNVQSAEVANVITAALYQLRELDESGATIKLKIPKEIKGEEYAITGGGKMLYIIMENGERMNFTVPVNVRGRLESGTTGMLQMKYLNKSAGVLMQSVSY